MSNGKICFICHKSFKKPSNFGRCCSLECSEKKKNLPSKCKPFCLNENMKEIPVMFINNTNHVKKICGVCFHGTYINAEKESSKESYKEKVITAQHEFRSKKYKDSFYNGKKWLSLRYDFLFSSKNKECAICGSIKKPFHVDHILPRSKYPELEYKIENLQILCAECNLGKSDK